jgi:hypothetical protein
MKIDVKDIFKGRIIDGKFYETFSEIIPRAEQFLKALGYE